MENTDYKNAYEYAISRGKSDDGAKFYASTFCKYITDILPKEFEEDPEEFKIEHEGRSFEEIAQNIVFDEIDRYEEAKSWNHSEEWAYFYADDENETKDGAYQHIRAVAPERIYSEAYNEYIARGYSEKYSTLIAQEILEPKLHDRIAYLEGFFQEYERLYKYGKSKDKSDEFADYFANFCCYDICDSYGWTISLIREMLQKENKSENYINAVINYLDQYDDIHEGTLDEEADDHYKIIQSFGYADGEEYAIKNKIPKTNEFAKIMANSYHECMSYDRIHPYKELALYQTIEEYNRTAIEKLPITQFQLALLERLNKEIEKDNEEYRKHKYKF